MAEAVTLEFVWVNVGKLVFSVQQPTFHPTKSAHPTTHKRPFHPATHPSTCPPTTHQPNNSPTHHPSSTTRPAPATCHLSPTTHHTQHFNVSWKAFGVGLEDMSFCVVVCWHACGVWCLPCFILGGGDNVVISVFLGRPEEIPRPLQELCFSRAGARASRARAGAG